MTEKSYGYKIERFSHNDFNLFYAHVKNEIGEYFIAPSFGDFIYIENSNFEALNRLYDSNKGIPIKLKVLSETKPDLKNFEASESGFIHQI